MKVLVIEPIDCDFYEKIVEWKSLLRELREDPYHDLPHLVTMVER